MRNSDEKKPFTVTFFSLEWVPRSYTVGPPMIELAFTVGVILVIGKMFRVTSSPSYGAATVLITFLGFVLFSVAKLSMFRQGLWLTWGPSKMTTGYRYTYWAGYIFVGIGSLMMLFAMNQRGWF